MTNRTERKLAEALRENLKRRKVYAKPRAKGQDPRAKAQHPSNPAETARAEDEREAPHDPRPVEPRSR